MTSLIPIYREMVANGENFHGLSLLQYKEHVRILIKQYAATSLLDYGSGRGDAYLPPHEVHRDWGIAKPTLYDPAFATHDALPDGKRFDGVICSDVLEHVPEEEVDCVICDLLGYATKFAWASVCCRPAKKQFADGTNMHVTIHPMGWWRARFNAVSDGKVAYHLIETK